jgi:hypothetical protein
MKIIKQSIVVLLCLLVSMNVFPQSRYEKNGLRLTVCCYPKKIISDDVQFVLKITNISDSVILIPRSYYANSANAAPTGNVMFEIFFCNVPDTCKMIEPVTVLVSEEKIEGFIDLQPHEAYLVGFNLSKKRYFRKHGTYKVRFLAQKSEQLDNLPTDLSTHWIYVTVE